MYPHSWLACERCAVAQRLRTRSQNDGDCGVQRPDDGVCLLARRPATKGNLQSQAHRSANAGVMAVIKLAAATMWRQGVPVPHTIPQELISERTHDFPDTDHVLAGREEQGAANSSEEVASLPTHTAQSQHHQGVDQPCPDDIVALNIEGWTRRSRWKPSSCPQGEWSRVLSQAEKSRLCQHTRLRARARGKYLLWNYIINEWTRLAQTTTLR